VVFNDVGMTVLGGTPLFRLTHFENAIAVYHGMARRGVLTRAFSWCPQWIRFGPPADDEAFSRFETALREAVKEAGK